MAEKTKERGISTKVVRLNIDVILNNYNKPEFWKQEWLIYKSNLIEIKARLSSIDLKRNLIEMEVFSNNDTFYLPRKKKRVHFWYLDNLSRHFDIPISHSDYSADKFKHDLLSNCLELIRFLEQEFIKTYGEYKQADTLESDYRDKLEEIANDFLDENDVSNSEIRDAYVDHYVDNCDIPDYTGDVMNNFRYTVMPSEYLMLTAFFDDKERYEEYSKKCSKVRKSTRIKIWLDMKKLEEDEDFIEEMKDNLESI